MPGGPAVAPQYNAEGYPVRVFIDGKFYWWSELTEGQRQSYLSDHPEVIERVRDAEASAVASRTGEAPDETREDIAFLRERGFDTNPEAFDLEQMLRGSGIDVDNPDIQLMLQEAGETLQDPEILRVLVPQWQQKYPAVPATQFTAAFEASGFEGAYAPRPSPGASQLAAHEPGLEPTDISGPVAPYRMHPSTGWLQFKSGVLVDPTGSSGRLVWYDPVSTAPGSPRWFRETVANWSSEKIAEWRSRLHQFGYLDKDQAKAEGIDSMFTDALQRYQDARYLNGGKPVVEDASLAGGADKPPLVNVRRDMGATIRNLVREQYRSVFGTDPSDGEVSTYSDFIFKTAMDLQRKYRRKYGEPQAQAAVSEASERAIEKIEGTPEAQLVMESEEENTRLRDALEASVMATRGLV